MGKRKEELEEEPLDPKVEGAAEGANGAVEDSSVMEEPLSGDSELESQLAEARAEAKTNYDNYLRALADLDNYKKRALKERSEIIRYAGESLARDLVEVLDNLELALSQRAPGVNEELLKGVEMIRDQFLAVFSRYEIKGEPTVGMPFDPNKQQAMASVPTKDHPPGTVVEEYKKTYFFKDKLLRTGQVVVAGETAGEEE